MYRSCRSAAAFLVCVPACGDKQSPSPVQPSAEDQFAALEHGYAVYIMSRFPVVATYFAGRRLMWGSRMSTASCATTRFANKLAARVQRSRYGTRACVSGCWRRQPWR